MVADDTRIEELAYRVRIADDRGRLDVESTAQCQEIRLSIAELGHRVEAITLDGVITLNSHFPSAGRRRFVFAHELGHLMIERGAMPWVTPEREEQWADWFAHECVFPRRWVRERSWRQLQLFTDPAERQTIGMHLAAYPREPAVLRVDDVVICGRCGDRSFADGCNCERYRNDARELRELPSLRPASEVNLDQLTLFATEDDPFALLWRILVSPPSRRKIWD